MRKIITALFALVAFSVFARNLNNPVIKGVADAGCIRYAGKYYLGGVSTYGDFFISSDLVNWSQRTHVFDLDNDWTRGTGAKNNQIHADDITYNNGLFHLLFSVNYWGKDRHIVHITHAVSPSITGPYRELRKDQWMENRIDPMVFKDDDGRLYLYMVKFTDGNTIWCRPLNKDYSFAGDAVCQFSSQPDTWETMDNRVAEGPFVVRYRDRYFMMYNANHTSPAFGNYRLGVCEASSPTSFNSGGKYPYPVVAPNTEAISDSLPDLLLYGSGHYEKPHWIYGEKVDSLNFYLQKRTQGNLYLKIIGRGKYSVMLNGTRVNSEAGNDFCLYSIAPSDVRQGKNTLAINRERLETSSHPTLALYDFGKEKADELLVTPGQPNIVRGPNGWEWWLVYMANQGWKRSQFIDRIHFTNGKLAVDGITGAHSLGFHPAPSRPQYCGTLLDSVPVKDAFLLELTMTCPKNQGIRIGTQEVQLPDSFDSAVPHEWRIEKDHNLLTVWIDHTLLFNHVSIDSTSKSLSFIGDARSYKVDCISFNEGFDEYGKYFTGWGCQSIGDKGMVLSAGLHLRGTAASSYELSVQTETSKTHSDLFGLMAAYFDKKNYVSAMIDPSSNELVVTQSVKGRTNVTRKSLTTNVPVYPDVKYTDSFEKQYRWDCDTYLSEIYIPHQSQDREDYVEDPAGTQQWSFLDGDSWKALNYVVVSADNPSFQRITFPMVQTRAIRCINKEPTDNNRHIYRLLMKICKQDRNQLRVERRGQELHILVNNHELFETTLRNDHPSRCGLISRGNNQVIVKDALWFTVQ